MRSFEAPKYLSYPCGFSKITFWNVSYIELQIFKWSKPWSSQLWTQFKQLRIEALKSQDFNGVQTPLKSWLAFITAIIMAYLISKSAVQCMTHFIYHFTSILHGLIRTHKWLAPNISGFIAQLVRASHWYREVTGSNPVEVLNFSGLFVRNCLNSIHNCDDHGLLYFIKSCLLYTSDAADE